MTQSISLGSPLYKIFPISTLQYKPDKSSFNTVNSEIFSKNLLKKNSVAKFHSRNGKITQTFSDVYIGKKIPHLRIFNISQGP